MFFLVATFKHHGDLPVGIRALQQIVAFFTNAFVGPIYATGLTLFYYDQRVRKEGFDIEWMMQAAGWTVRPAAPESASVPGLPPDLTATVSASDPLPEPGSVHE
jgi:hypothetical protein